MSELVVVLMVAAGYCLRDGWPPLERGLVARWGAALWCLAAGAVAAPGWVGVMLGAGAAAGLFTDVMHGEGARARGLRDVPALAISGTSSVLPLALVFGANPWALVQGYWIPDLPVLGGVVAAGALGKPAIWFVAWLLPLPWNHEPTAFLHPTRFAAIAAGAGIGLMLILL